MDIILGIDGTGPSSDTEYRTAFKNSHVNTMVNGWHTPARHYMRGPTWHGFSTETLALSGVKWVTQTYNLLTALHKDQAKFVPTKPRVFLTGFSRGAAAVTFICHRLQTKGIDVHALLLFDAVDRSTMEDTAVIPANVQMAYHARRDPKAGSREMFGNCALKAKNKGGYEEAFFLCTHGGVGGTPWKENGKSGKIEEMSTGQKVGATLAGGLAGKLWADQNDFTNVDVKQDAIGAKASGAWMNKKLTAARASGLTQKVGSIGPYNFRDVMMA